MAAAPLRAAPFGHVLCPGDDAGLTWSSTPGYGAGCNESGCTGPDTGQRTAGDSLLRSACRGPSGVEAPTQP